MHTIRFASHQGTYIYIYWNSTEFSAQFFSSNNNSPDNFLRHRESSFLILHIGVFFRVVWTYRTTMLVHLSTPLDRIDWWDFEMLLPENPDPFLMIKSRNSQAHSSLTVKENQIQLLGVLLLQSFDDFHLDWYEIVCIQLDFDQIDFWIKLCYFPVTFGSNWI